jgi:hypothetical protein
MELRMRIICFSKLDDTLGLIVGENGHPEVTEEVRSAISICVACASAHFEHFLPIFGS